MIHHKSKSLCFIQSKRSICLFTGGRNKKTRAHKSHMVYCCNFHQMYGEWRKFSEGWKCRESGVVIAPTVYKNESSDRLQLD